MRLDLYKKSWAMKISRNCCFVFFFFSLCLLTKSSTIIHIDLEDDFYAKVVQIQSVCIECKSENVFFRKAFIFTLASTFTIRKVFLNTLSTILASTCHVVFYTHEVFYTHLGYKTPLWGKLVWCIQDTFLPVFRGMTRYLQHDL